MRRDDPGPVNVPPGNVPPSGDVGERLAALAGQRPWWPLVEPTPRWIRVRIGGELVADSRRALLHVQYGRGALPRSFLPTYYVPVDDVLPAALVDPVEAEAGLTVWAVAAAGLRADDAAWMHHRPPQPLEGARRPGDVLLARPADLVRRRGAAGRACSRSAQAGRRGGKLEGRPGRDRRRAAGREPPASCVVRDCPPRAVLPASRRCPDRARAQPDAIGLPVQGRGRVVVGADRGPGGRGHRTQL